MRVFIARPFGIKRGIDFDRVERELLTPVIKAIDAGGGSALEILHAGPIHEDMFRELAVSDLVIADISIHNANVYYELGVRHALRRMRTFLIRARMPDKPDDALVGEEQVPFDIHGDRYLAYDPSNPAASVAGLTTALKDTLDGEPVVDSPVFRSLPKLEQPDYSKLAEAPLPFVEEVERQAKDRQCGRLALLRLDVDDLTWERDGLHRLGLAQFFIKDFEGSRATWEALREFEQNDVEANERLATVYQRLGDAERSNQAARRVIAQRPARPEPHTLLARNEKALWEKEWREVADRDARRKQALKSPALRAAREQYHEAFLLDLNDYYPGVNALSLTLIEIELAASFPDVWASGYDSVPEADAALAAHKELAADLVPGVRRAIRRRQELPGHDWWADISAADLIFYTNDNGNRIERAYADALKGAEAFHHDAVRTQLGLFERLDIFPDRVVAALRSVVSETAAARKRSTRVVLFTGHRVDDPGKAERFPGTSEAEKRAREAIATEIKSLRAVDEDLLGIAGAASGGDILFHEICRELGIPTRVLIAMSQERYAGHSVTPAGRAWVERYERLLRETKPEVLDPSGEMPGWLRPKRNYNIWQRSNLWMLCEAQAAGASLTLVALWNGKGGKGPGGTQHMVEEARRMGAGVKIIEADRLFADLLAREDAPR